MRYAVYWCPGDDDPLLTAGANWLGWRLSGEKAGPQPQIARLSAARFAELTRIARRYGFHATIKPPLALVDGATEAGFLQAVRDLANHLTPVSMPRLEVARLAGFIALRPVETEAALRAIADRVVSVLDPFRRPPTKDELVRRASAGLAPRERTLLEQWGYPYVFEAYRFHMTLSDPLSGQESDILMGAARRHFAVALTSPRLVDGLCVFIETDPAGPFRLLARVPFGGRALALGASA